MELKSHTILNIRKEIQAVAQAITQVQWWRWILSIGIVIVAIIFVQSVGEFLVALENRYATYAVGTDTNMYGRSGALAAILSLSAAWMVAFVCKLSLGRWYIPASLLLLSMLGTIFYLPEWIEWLVILVYFATMAVSFWTRIFFFVPLVAVFIVSASINSFLPEDWCKYELTMYRCSENIQYNIDPFTEQKIIEFK